MNPFTINNLTKTERAKAKQGGKIGRANMMWGGGKTGRQNRMGKYDVGRRQNMKDKAGKRGRSKAG